MPEHYKVANINNRRYLGNKYSLLPFIIATIKEQCTNINKVADIFSGTGAVASAFADKVIITNDIMYSNYICNYAWFGSKSFSKDKIIDMIHCYNEIKAEDIGDNYMTDNFADTYFSYRDCAKIGYIREDIEKKFGSDEINERERAILIAALLYGMDRIAQTCGHYDAYRKNAEFISSLELPVPNVNHHNNSTNQCFNTDANELVKNIYADLVYIDPPYNSRQYSDTYHLLENVAKWSKPQVYGVARKMNRAAIKSKYCTHDAPAAFANLIENIQARYILFSYNNMSTKGNDRSNAKISDEDIWETMQLKGQVQVFSRNYKAFTTGKSDIEDNEERLFLCEVK